MFNLSCVTFTDASIWMIQFMKAMRDERGEMVRNAHILGFFRRICKLLFLRTKPVFVFDGATPALKRRTVIARRRQRENAQTKIRKTAEKLLLNHVSYWSIFFFFSIFHYIKRGIHEYLYLPIKCISFFFFGMKGLNLSSHDLFS